MQNEALQNHTVKKDIDLVIKLNSIHLELPSTSVGGPVLPPRKPVSHHIPGYENIPEKDEEPLPPRESASGYVNLPPRPERSSSEPPDLPPRKPPQTQRGYENIPTRDDSSLRARNLPYQNIRPDGMVLYVSSCCFSP